MLNKYIFVNNEPIVVSQNTSGTWLCKELSANDTDELEKKIGKVIEVLNKYNSGETKLSKFLKKDQELKEP